MAQLSYDIAGDQIDGARDYQEDAFLITHLSNVEDDQQALVIVADGMGGHAAGNVASNMAVQAFNKHVSANYPVSDISLIPDILRASINKANDALKETVKETAALSGMGCTMVGVLLANGKLWWASVGDSHLYLIRDNELKKLNADHSYGGFLDRMAAEGKQIEVDSSLSRNMLMSALTGAEIAEIDVSAEPFILQPNDSLVIASDGLDTLVRDEIVKQSGWAPDAKETAAALIKAVEDVQRPRQDNTTVVNVRTALVESKSPPAYDYSEARDETAADTDIGGSRAQPEYDEDTRGGGGFGKIAAILVVIVIGLVGADFVLKLGIIFPKEKAPLATTATEETGSEIVETSEEAVEPSTATESKPEKVVATTTETAEKPGRKRPHLVNPFTDKLKGGSSGPIMVFVPEDEFMMGAGKLSTRLDERPQHKVKLKAFAISQYEITFAEFERFAKEMGSHSPERSGINPKTSPIVNISWQDAQDYTSWLSRKTRHKYQLPTESQWEYAARAGTTGSYWWGLDIGSNRAHCLGCGSPANMRAATNIGMFEPNPWGLYDTSGNVAEWTQDCYNPNYQNAPNDGTAWHDGDCSKRIVRGGSFSNAGSGSTNTRREKYNAGSKLSHIGFRVVREK